MSWKLSCCSLLMGQECQSQLVKSWILTTLAHLLAAVPWGWRAYKLLERSFDSAVWWIWFHHFFLPLYFKLYLFCRALVAHIRLWPSFPIVCYRKILHQIFYHFTRWFCILPLTAIFIVNVKVCNFTLYKLLLFPRSMFTTDIFSLFLECDFASFGSFTFIMGSDEVHITWFEWLYPSWLATRAYYNLWDIIWYHAFRFGSVSCLSLLYVPFALTMPDSMSIVHFNLLQGIALSIFDFYMTYSLVLQNFPPLNGPQRVLFSPIREVW